MSAQGGTLRTPLHVPLRPVIAVILATVMALGIGLGVRELVQQPARTGGAVAEFDWAPQVGHPQVRDRDGSSMPVQRLYPDGFGEPALDGGLEDGFGSHQQL